MRLILASLLALPFLFASNYHPLEDDEGLDFINEDYSAAMSKAKSEGKLVYAFVYGNNCSSSKKMSNLAFEDEDVAAFYEANFISVKLDADELKNNLRLTAWGVTGVPTHVFVNTQRKVVLMAGGYQSPDGIIAVGQEALEEAN